ncbi:hypothetical protein V6N13_124882 [Hibiscus sabdariffa]
MYGDWLRYIPTKRQEFVFRSKGSIRYLDANSSTPNLTENGKSYEPSKTVAATKKFGHTSQPIIPSNPDSDATKADIDAESSIVVPLAAAAQPPVVLAADTTDAFTIEDADDATAAAAEGATLPTTPNGSSVTMHANRNATISWSKAQRPII